MDVDGSIGRRAEGRGVGEGAGEGNLFLPLILGNLINTKEMPKCLFLHPHHFPLTF